MLNLFIVLVVLALVFSQGLRTRLIALFRLTEHRKNDGGRGDANYQNEKTLGEIIAEQQRQPIKNHSVGTVAATLKVKPVPTPIITPVPASEPVIVVAPLSRSQAPSVINTVPEISEPSIPRLIQSADPVSPKIKIVPANQLVTRRWIPFGETIEIGGKSIKGGIYYGSNARNELVQPVSLIDPTLPFTFENPDRTGALFSYWPQYAQLDPRSRGTFLSFLANRENDEIGIGYVFMYFYGLEHRVLVDALHDELAKAEVPTIFAEVRRLLDRYGNNHSLAHYLSLFLEAAPTLAGCYAETSPAPNEVPTEWTSAMQLGLGRLAVTATPLSADWAMAWARIYTEEAHSSTWQCVMSEIRLRFAQRYTETYGAGFLIPASKSALKIEYRWAAPRIPNPSTFITELPDISRLTAPVRPLVQILKDVLLELEPLRKVRRSKNRTPIAELAVLPPTLRNQAMPAELTQLATQLDRALAHNTTAQLSSRLMLAACRINTQEKLTKREATVLAQAVESLGFGIEPDVRFFGEPILPKSYIVVFRQPENPTRNPSPSYASALLLVQASMAVAAAEGGIIQAEIDAAIRGVEAHYDLPVCERARLNAHVKYLKDQTLNLSRIERQVKQLAETDREAFAQVLVSIAGADGHIAAEEVRLIGRFYKALNLPIARVPSDLHRASLGTSKPVSASNQLDPQMIVDKLAETSRVQAMLANIFVAQNDEAANPVSIDVTSVSDANRSPRIAAEGLDPAYSALLRQVLSVAGETWPREDFETICEPLGLLPDGAMEMLNQTAFDCCDEALIEGDDPLFLNTYSRDLLREKFFSTT